MPAYVHHKDESRIARDSPCDLIYLQIPVLGGLKRVNPHGGAATGGAAKEGAATGDAAGGEGRPRRTMTKVCLSMSARAGEAST